VADHDRARALPVALDATPLLGQRTGIGHWTDATLRALAARDDLDVRAYAVTRRGRDALVPALPPAVAPATRRFPAQVALRSWRHVDRPRVEHWTGEVDVVHATCFVGPPSRAGVVVTVHDLAFARLPDLCGPGSRHYPRLLRRALARGATVHTVSDTVAREVREVFGVPAERVVRVYPGVLPSQGGDPAAGRQAAGADRYVLALGQLEPRKGLPALVRAFDAAAGADARMRLVLAGPDGPDRPRVERAIAAACHGDRVRWLGYVPDRTRRDLLAGSTLLAYPSLYEGFGHPPLEAMSAGVPVRSTACCALPEVLGEAARLVPVGDDEALAHGLELLLKDDAARDELVSRGFERVRHFDWNRSAGELVALYQRIEERAVGGRLQRPTASDGNVAS